MGKYFGTDGVRGVAGETLTDTMAKQIGNALKKTFKTDKVIIGEDTRKSSNLLALSVALGAMQSGMDVLYAGVVSTPMIAHYSKEKSIVGIMVTASHNPYQDNGIKVFNKGIKMSADEEVIVEKFIDGEDTLEKSLFGGFKSVSITKTYETLYSRFKSDTTNQSVTIDTANGATSFVAEEILSKGIDELQVINNLPDGYNINVECGSTHIEALRKAVQANQSDLGFAFDGDGDRVLGIDHQGKIYDGDLLIYILAVHLKSQNKLSKNTVVLTKMSNPGIVSALKANGIKTIRTDVGDKYVVAEIKKGGYSLGGENSGHIILNDILQTGDGILVASQILKVLQETKKTLPSLVENVEYYPQKIVNIKDVDKTLLEHKMMKTAIKEAKKTLGTDSLLLVRPSGTEPLIRLMVSHRDDAMVDRVLKQLQDTLLELGRENDA